MARKKKTEQEQDINASVAIEEMKKDCEIENGDNLSPVEDVCEEIISDEELELDIEKETLEEENSDLDMEIETLNEDTPVIEQEDGEEGEDIAYNPTDEELDKECDNDPEDPDEIVKFQPKKGPVVLKRNQNKPYNNKKNAHNRKSLTPMEAYGHYAFGIIDD